MGQKKELLERKIGGKKSKIGTALAIVPILKPDGSIRICDYKLTMNQAAKPDVYTLPRAEDLLATLAGGKSCSKLDLAQAHQQIPLDESSKPYITINTHKGLYRYNRQLRLYIPEDYGEPPARHTTCVHLFG